MSSASLLSCAGHTHFCVFLIYGSLGVVYPVHVENAALIHNCWGIAHEPDAVFASVPLNLGEAGSVTVMGQMLLVLKLTGRFCLFVCSSYKLSPTGWSRLVKAVSSLKMCLFITQTEHVAEAAGEAWKRHLQGGGLLWPSVSTQRRTRTEE